VWGQRSKGAAVRVEAGEQVCGFSGSVHARHHVSSTSCSQVQHCGTTVLQYGTIRYLVRHVWPLRLAHHRDGGVRLWRQDVH
jgi:hypothetical protein